jgi:hypothetical protein
LVAGCTLTKKNHEKRVSDIVVRELKRAKPCVGGCIQSREVWSTEEKANMRTGHFWICKFGTAPGSMTCVEKKFEFQGRKRKWEEYKDTRYSDGDSALVVELWLHRVADALSGLTFQEWYPSAGTDDTSAPVAMFVNLSDLCVSDFPLTEVRPLHLDVVSRGVRRTCGVTVRKLQVSVIVRLYSPWKTTMTSGKDVSEYLDTSVLVKSYFFEIFLRKKMKKNFKKMLGTPIYALIHISRGFPRP